MSDDLDDDLEDGGDIDADIHSYQDVREMILAGLSSTDLAAVLRVDRRTMQLAVGAIRPVGKRNNRPIYAIADAAPLVVKPVLDVESYIKKLKPKDLPPSLQKAFWDAQEARQSFEEKAGNLWHTHRVQEVIGKLVMIVRQRLVLGTDQVDRQAPLTEEQRRLVQATFDNIITELQKSVVEAFKDYDGTGDRQELFENGPARPFRAADEEDDGLGDGL